MSGSWACPGAVIIVVPAQAGTHPEHGLRRRSCDHIVNEAGKDERVHATITVPEDSGGLCRVISWSSHSSRREGIVGTNGSDM